MQLLNKNFKYIREKSGQNQAQLSISLGFSRGAWNNYETGKSTPSLSDFVKISKYFGYSATDLIETDLENVNLNPKPANQKKGENVNLIVNRNVNPTAQKEYKTDDLRITVVAEPDAEYGTKSSVIPITDISVAAGTGILNNDFIENVDSIRLPAALLKLNKTYLCVKIKGLSMSPTLQDGGYAVIRLLERQEWAKMHDERIYVVSDNDGKSYLKRIKNRFKQGFIVLRSDNPDQASYAPFNLEAGEINTIWYVEWYFSAKMPNIHDQYYTRLQRLEDKVDLMEAESRRINRK